MSAIYSDSLSATQRMINAIIYGLKQIKTENGYTNTLYDVFLEIPTLSQLVNFPSVVITMGKEVTDWDETNTLVNTLPITLMVFLKEVNNPTDARLSLKKDIHRHFGLNWMVRGEDGTETCRLIKPTSYQPFGMFLTSPQIGFVMELQVTYDQDVEDPTVAA